MRRGPSPNQDKSQWKPCVVQIGSIRGSKINYIRQDPEPDGENMINKDTSQNKMR